LVITGRFLPYQRIYFRKKDVCSSLGKGRLHVRDVQPVGQVHGLAVYLGPANNKHLGLLLGLCFFLNQCLFQREAAARKHHVLSAGQRFSQGFKSFTPHDDGVAHGKGFEMPQVFRNMPQQVVVGTQFSLGANDGNEG